MELDKRQLSELDALLAQREIELAQAVQQAREVLANPGSHGWPEVKDSVEDGDARMMDSLDLAQLQRQEHALIEAREARQRIRDGRYGTCEQCGEDIGFDRLQVVPTTRFCLEDEARRERAGTAP